MRKGRGTIEKGYWCGLSLNPHGSVQCHSERSEESPGSYLKARHRQRFQSREGLRLYYCSPPGTARRRFFTALPGHDAGSHPGSPHRQELANRRYARSTGPHGRGANRQGSVFARQTSGTRNPGGDIGRHPRGASCASRNSARQGSGTGGHGRADRSLPPDSPAQYSIPLGSHVIRLGRIGEPTETTSVQCGDVPKPAR